MEEETSFDITRTDNPGRSEIEPPKTPTKKTKEIKAWAIVNEFNFNTISCSQLLARKGNLFREEKKVNPLNVFGIQEEAEEMLRIWEEKNPYQAHDLSIVKCKITYEKRNSRAKK